METLQRTANRGSVSTGYDIDNSCKFEADNTEKIQSAESDAGNRRTWTFSIWCKRTELGSGNFALWSIGDSFIGFEADKLMVSLQYSGSSDFRFKTNRLFRDTSAFYHIVVAVDTTQGTDTNRLKIYVNGVQETSFSSTGAGYPSQNFDTGFVIGSNTDHPIGNSAGGDAGFCGYLSEILFIDTLQKAPTDFGEFDDDSGTWIPKKYSGAFPGRSFWYEFKNSGSMGTDSSGNSHTGLLNNITASDQATDTPTNNFATFNPLYLTVGTYPEGATKYTTNAYGGWKSVYPTMGAESGKWYAEFKHVDSAGSKFIGVVPFSLPGLPRGEAGYSYYGSTSDSIGYFNDGNRYINGGAASYGASWNNSDIMSIALDMDNGKVYFAKNGTWQNSGDPTSGATGTGAIDLIEPTQAHAFGPSLYDGNTSMLCNYGGYTTISISSAASDANGYGSFEYAPPSSYYALCTKNLAEYG